MRIASLILTALLAAWSQAALADSLTLPGTELYGDKWQQNRSLTLEAFTGHTVLIAFWRSDCAPCREEMKNMPSLARQHPDTPIVIAALQGAEDIRADLPEHFPPNAHIIVVEGDAVEILKLFGDSMLALPYSVALHHDGSLCSRHYGPLGTELADWWVRKC